MSSKVPRLDRNRNKMSATMIQPDILGQSPGFYTATLPKSVISFSSHLAHQRSANPLLIFLHRRFDFMRLPVEILALILGELAAGQLTVFRCLCRAFHDSVTANEYAIASSILKTDLYRTASKLYYRHIYCPRPPPNTLHLDDLYQLARRCDSARHLALLLAQNHIESLIRTAELAGIAPDQAYSVTKVAENIYPYIIGLFHFLEEYRFALATFVPDPSCTTATTPSSQISRRLLAQYNQETVDRLRILYGILLAITEQKVPRIDLVTLDAPLRVPFYTHISESDASYLDIFVFGGLEAVRDIIAQTSVSAGVDYIVAHFSKATPFQLPFNYKHRYHATLVPLPKPLLPELDRQTAIDIYSRLPSAHSLMLMSEPALWGWGMAWLNAEDKKFLGYLATHEGSEPKLLS